MIANTTRPLPYFSPLKEIFERSRPVEAAVMLFLEVEFFEVEAVLFFLAAVDLRAVLFFDFEVAICFLVLG
jgi:hypothetical protein